MKKFLSLMTVIAILLTTMVTLSSCGEEFVVYSCGSGFFFNADENKTYKIKELGVESRGNWFYLEDYFYSKTLGTPYTLKLGFMKKETVYLAKKADHYNSEVFKFNLDTYEEDIITITPEMSYVHIYASNPDEVHFVYIEIEDRTMPVDITLENVNIDTNIRLPVLFSKSMSDINLIVKGENTLSAGMHNYSQENFGEYVAGMMTAIEETFYDSIAEVFNKVSEFEEKANQNGMANHLTSELVNIGKSAASLFEDFLEGGMAILGGEKGSNGIEGIAAIMHYGGISVSGTGTLKVNGGSGARGGDANDSLAGLSDGGDGGRGGAGIHCGYFFSTGTVNLVVSGGEGGSGGDPSDGLFGLFGSSGDKGATGSNGRDYDVLQSKIAK